MKILMVTDTYYPKIDGIVTSVVNTSQYLANQRHRIVILAPHYDIYYKEKKHENIKIFRFRSFSFPAYKEVKVVLPNIRKVLKIFKKFKPDIVHIHTPGPLGLLGLVLAKRERIPIVNTYHTSIPDMLLYISPTRLFDSLISTLDRNKGDTWKEIQKNVAQIKERLTKSRKKGKKKKREPFTRRAVWAISKRFYNPSDLVIAPSKRTEKELIKHNVQTETTVISNGIELNMFRKKNRYSTTPKFLHVGRLGYEKYIDIVIAAMKKVVKRHPEAILSIVGDGPARKSLQKQVRKLGLEENIKFYGFLPREKLPQIYRKHDIFVTASEIETQGLVLIEAMACGLPVIGVRVLAIPDVVHDGKTGFLVPRKNSEEMARHMMFLFEHPKLVKEMGKKAREEAEKHDISETMKKLEKAYFELLKYSV